MEETINSSPTVDWACRFKENRRRNIGDHSWQHWNSPLDYRHPLLGSRPLFVCPNWKNVVV